MVHKLAMVRNGLAMPVPKKVFQFHECVQGTWKKITPKISAKADLPSSGQTGNCWTCFARVPRGCRAPPAPLILGPPIFVGLTAAKQRSGAIEENRLLQKVFEKETLKMFEMVHQAGGCGWSVYDVKFMQGSCGVSLLGRTKGILLLIWVWVTSRSSRHE